MTNAKKKDAIDLQNEEFAAVKELAAQYRRITLTPIVDDDYPEVRHGYDSALHQLIDVLWHNRTAVMHMRRPRLETPDGQGLTFAALRAANRARLPQFKNKHGGLAHSKPDGSDWSPAQWLQAVVGELGEYANLRKKFERGDIGAEEFWHEACNELADVATYLDILAFRLNIDLGAAVVEKFNQVSARVGSEVRLDL